ncbi:MAG: hypothetical protein K0R45_1100 [Pseudomonas sp.]|nr:hypothetical protein [Pseudomonas sp.]
MDVWLAERESSDRHALGQARKKLRCYGFTGLYHAVFATFFSYRTYDSAKTAIGIRAALGCADQWLFETLLAFLIALALMFDPAFEFGQHVGDPLPNLAFSIFIQRGNSRTTPNQDIG